MLEALRDRVLAACVGPVTAAPLQRLGVPVGARRSAARLGALVRSLVDELPGRAPHASRCAGARGRAARPRRDRRRHARARCRPARWRCCARSPPRPDGRVPGGAARALPRGADEHAVEMAVARLRAALGGPAFVQTVVKRGYRLRVD